MGGTGIWLIGARGSVATTATVGLLGLRAGLVPPIGMVTETAPLATTVGLPALDDLVIGGHDVVDTPLDKRAELLAESGVLPHRLLGAVRDGLTEVETQLRPGYHPVTSPGPQAAVADRLTDDIDDFRARHGLDRVVVVDVSSTEAPTPAVPAHADPDALATALADPTAAVLPPSSLAALAAIRAGAGWVGFTPSTGVRLPALLAVADAAGVPLAGCDGKTGETLVKSVLAPMFAARALRVNSWAGTNLLGGGDGATLGDPVTAAAKLESKAAGAAALLGPDVTAPLHIDNVPDLGDWKTAWDHISFTGFLGARMSLQFTWTGCDSALAAPLVLDLARLTAAAHAAGHAGPQSALGFFFKDPLAPAGEPVDHTLFGQTTALRTWAAGLGEVPA